MGGDDAKEINVQAAAVTAMTTPLRAVPAAHADVESLFREHHEHIFRTAYRVTGSASDAEDVLQTVFLRLVKGGDKYDMGAEPAHYLHRAAVNAALDLVRRRTRAKSVSFDAVEPALLESPGASPEREQADRELRKLIQEAVARLGTRAAEIFVLRYFEGYDNHEIAKRLGTSQMVVAVTLHRARARLRAEIGAYLEKHHEASF